MTGVIKTDANGVIQTDANGVLQTVSSGGSSQFDVVITGTNGPAAPGESLDVAADVTNSGGVSDTQIITLDIDNGVGQVDSKSVTLSAGQSSTETLTWAVPSGQTEQDYTATVASSDDSATATVSTVPATGVLLYRFNDDSNTNTTIDAIGSNNGSISGASYDSNADTGDNALSFDGVDDYVEIPSDNLVPSNGDFTIIADVLPNSNNDFKRIVSNNNAQNGRWDFYIDGSEKAFFFADDLSTSLTGNITFSTGSYTKVALRRSGDDWAIIVDDGSGAVIDSTLTQSATLDTSVNYYVGWHAEKSSDGFSGLIDGFYIDQSALSLNDIEAHPY